MSTKVWFCANCGYEVNSRGRCHSCGERLVASPLAELASGPDDDEVGYRLDQWDDQTRARLIRLLVNAGVLHRFEEEELVVLASDEAQVDKLVSRATGVPAHLDEDGEEGPQASIADISASQELYAAAKALRDDPTDMQADIALAQASAAVFSVDYLPELDEDHMAAIGRVTRRLLGALGADEALEGEIRHEAEILCRLVAPSAGAEATGAEADRARARLVAAAKERGRSVELPQSEVTPGGEVPATALAAGAGGGEHAATGPLAAGEAGIAVGGQDDAAVTLQGGAKVFQATAVGPAEGTGGGGGGQADEAVLGEAAQEGAEPDPGEGDGEDEDEDEEGSGELVYELAEWLPEQRVELSFLLENAGIAYNWDATDLTIAEEHEGEVDGLFEQVHGLVDDDDEARYRSIEELFGSVDRLANDPGNEDRQQAFLGAVGAVELPTPVGVDDAFWWRIRSQGHLVVAALEGDARVEEISREAALLAEMLHEMV